MTSHLATPESQIETPDPEGAHTAPSGPARVLALLRQHVITGAFIVMIVAFAAASPDTFPTWQNVQNILQGVTVLGLIAVAVTVVLALGAFDLAAPNVAAFAAALIAVLVTQGSLTSGAGVYIGIVCGIAVAVLLSGISGMTVAAGHSSFVVTLALSSMAAGLELLVQQQIAGGGTNVNRFLLPKPVQWLSDAHILGLRPDFWLLVIAAAATALVMKRTALGRQTMAIGSNEAAAYLAGVPVKRVKIVVFLLSGLLVGLAGVVLVAQQGYFPQSGPPFLLKAYAAAFLGAAIFRRSGFSVGATLFGVLFLQVLSNGLVLLGSPPWVTAVVQGAVLFATVTMVRRSE